MHTHSHNNARGQCRDNVGDRCKVKYYKGEVLIALISVLDIMPLAIIYAVACVYNR